MTVGTVQASENIGPRRGSKHPSFFRRTPCDPGEWHDAELLDRARRYARPLKRARRLGAALSMVIAVGLVVAQVGPAITHRLPGLPWPLQLLAVLAATTLVETVAGLPLGYWVTLVHERRWGFSTETVGLWVSDQLKGLGLALVIGWILLGALFWLIRLTPLWWLAAGGLVGLVAVLASFIFPVLILPMFNKQRPLEGELAERIKALARLAGVPVKHAFLMDASKRSTRDNAFVGGVGSTKRVVVFDTMLEHPGHVLDNVVAHELGHYRLRHILIQVPVVVVLSILEFGAIAVVAGFPAVLRVAGVGSLGEPAALPLLALLMALGAPAQLLAIGWFTRALERQADLEALELLGDPGGFIDVWRRLTSKNLGDLEPSWYARAKHTHPENAERMAFIRDWAALNSVPIVEPVAAAAPAAGEAATASPVAGEAAVSEPEA